MRVFTGYKGDYPVVDHHRDQLSQATSYNRSPLQGDGRSGFHRRATLSDMANLKHKLTPFSPPIFTENTVTLAGQTSKTSIPITSSPASTLEVLLLTSLLLTLLSLIVYLAWQISSVVYHTLHRRRCTPPTPSPFDSRHNRPSRPCLWEGSFPDHTGSHVVYQLGGGTGAADSSSNTALEGVMDEALHVVNGARKRSVEAFGKMHRDFVELRRRLSRANGEAHPMGVDVEVGITAGMEGVDVEGLCLRRGNSFARKKSVV
ncbi:hypothetical protein B0T14DRAFT_494556 [Immersiella caudata]|uniref:Uncharacterized protein n=1 Tax=Immersiella caudata TaxID=314043 RepID=A0AA39WWQ9_9PEZI|nr:hypothetical protein B0T14DRAFT_494556 [Immersiella caudata]